MCITVCHLCCRLLYLSPSHPPGKPILSPLSNNGHCGWSNPDWRKGPRHAFGGVETVASAQSTWGWRKGTWRYSQNGSGIESPLPKISFIKRASGRTDTECSVKCVNKMLIELEREWWVGARKTEPKRLRTRKGVKRRKRRELSAVPLEKRWRIISEKFENRL